MVGKRCVLGVVLLIGLAGVSAANAEPTGLPPNVEVDIFGHTLGQLELQHPSGERELIRVTGSTVVHVIFEGATVGPADDDNGNSRDEVPMEMVDLSLTGMSPLLGLPVQVRLNSARISDGLIEEQTNANPGLLDVPPFTPVGLADSFFDVFVEIEVGGLVLHTIDPLPLTSVIAHKPPGPAAAYVSDVDLELYNEIGDPTGYILGPVIHRPAPPIEIDIFDRSIGQFELVRPDGTRETIHARGPTTVHVYFEGDAEGTANDDDADTLDEVQMEMVAMNLTGDSSFGPAEVRLNPERPTVGEIKETANNTGGVLDVPPFGTGFAESFFDVFVEIEVGGLVQRTIDPMRMTGLISHKPPGPGDVYINEIDIPLYDEFGTPTGFLLGPAVHRPAPPIEIDIFDQSVGQFILVHPDGTRETVHADGPTVVNVYFEGDAEGTANDDDSDTFDEVQTEMVAMDLSGSSSFGPTAVRLNPARPTVGEIRETVNNVDGVLELPPFSADGVADSFFDVFVEIEVGGLVQRTIDPMRMISTITFKPPGPGDVYINDIDIPLFDEFGTPTGFLLGPAWHWPRPPIEIDIFPHTSGEFELVLPTGPELIQLSGPTTVHVFFEGALEGDATDHDGDGRDEVQTRMVDMDLTGTSSLGPVRVRLNPTYASYGEIEETTNNTPGRLDVPPFTTDGTADSFFDVFVEIELPDVPMLLHTLVPKRMTSVITHKPPNPGDIYIGAATPIELYDPTGTPTGIFLQNATHRPNPGDIPAVSTWGMIVMGLLLLAAGGVAITKRRRLTAA